MYSGKEYLHLTIVSPKPQGRRISSQCLHCERPPAQRPQNNNCRKWVSPFGDLWIKACSRLPRAFRSVPRPSSPLSAKASTECPYDPGSLSLSILTLQWQSHCKRNHHPPSDFSQRENVLQFTG